MSRLEASSSASGAKQTLGEDGPNVRNGWKADVPLLEFGFMAYDFNKLEMRALELAEAGSINDALRIYLWMADGDSSFDGGYLGGRIGEC